MPARCLVLAPQPVFTPRGTPLSVYHRARAAAALGVTADLLTYAEGADPLIEGVRIVRIPRIPFLGAVRVGPSFGKLVRDVVMVLWTLGLLVRNRYPVVHAHEEAVFWCVPLKRLFGFRLIYDMHSSLAEQMRNFGLERWPFLVSAFRWMESRALRAADVVITISPYVSDVARRGMPDPDRNVLIENSVIDEVVLAGGPSRGIDAAPSIPADRRWVFYAGTFERYQGLELLLRAFRRVRRERTDAHLVLVGGRPEQVEALGAVARDLGLGDDCTFTGMVDQRTARALAGKAAVLTSPRISGTNTPLKVYELLASGTPFVATRIASHTQVLDASVCYLADPDPLSFAEGILAALDDGPAPARRAGAALARYQERYSSAVYVDKLHHVLEMVGLLDDDGTGTGPSDPNRAPGAEPNVRNRGNGVEPKHGAAPSGRAGGDVRHDRPPGSGRGGGGRRGAGGPRDPAPGDHRPGP